MAEFELPVEERETLDSALRQVDFLDGEVALVDRAIAHDTGRRASQPVWARAEQTARVRIARDELRRIRELTRTINDLHAELGTLVAARAPRLLAEPGCGVLTAAKLVGEIADVTRFTNDAKLARNAGTAPIPASSGRTQRHRLDHGGNRQINCALHRLAITKGRLDPKAPPTSPAAKPKAKPAAKPSAASSATSPAASGTYSTRPRDHYPHQHSQPPRTDHHYPLQPPDRQPSVDIKATCVDGSIPFAWAGSPRLR